MAIGAGANVSTGNNEMDVTQLTEDEQIALAIEMSMKQAASNSHNPISVFFS